MAWLFGKKKVEERNEMLNDISIQKLKSELTPAQKEYDKFIGEVQEQMNKPIEAEVVEEEAEGEKESRKLKKEETYRHLAVRPQTFARFRKIKQSKFRSDDAFVIECLDAYEEKMENLK